MNGSSIAASHGPFRPVPVASLPGHLPTPTRRCTSVSPGTPPLTSVICFPRQNRSEAAKMRLWRFWRENSGDTKKGTPSQGGDPTDLLKKQHKSSAKTSPPGVQWGLTRKHHYWRTGGTPAHQVTKKNYILARKSGNFSVSIHFWIPQLPRSHKESRTYNSSLPSNEAGHTRTCHLSHPTLGYTFNVTLSKCYHLKSK